MKEEVTSIKRQLERLEAKALLHGRAPAIELEILHLCGQLDKLQPGTGDDWLMDNDRLLGRAFQPLNG
jgi:hypothetical protein